MRLQKERDLVSFVMRLDQIDHTQTATVGGKAAQLAALRRIEGLVVPDGFVVTTEAFDRVVGQNTQITDLMARLADLAPDDEDTARVCGRQLRDLITGVAAPDALVRDVATALSQLGAHQLAVRSSATAEDLPGASFAGQHESYLGVQGLTDVLHHVRRCWASLFSDRAVAYRRRKNIQDDPLQMAVIVQQLVDAQASGVLFTADPLTSKRTVMTVEATSGLGDALMSGLTSADEYRLPAGGQVEAAPQQGHQRILTDEQVRELADIGRRIEASSGRPQDIEWCLSGGQFSVVQSRPITTLFPIPTKSTDGHRVYVSVGHQQMMTDAFKPLGLSFWQMTTPVPMDEAGNRLFVDVTRHLSDPHHSPGFLRLIGRSDPLIEDALRTVLDDVRVPSTEFHPENAHPLAAPVLIQADPTIVTELVGRSESALAAARSTLGPLSGSALMDAIRKDIDELQKQLFDPQSFQVLNAAMNATWWVNENIETWLGERGAADKLSLSAPGNITSQMGLALLDVADAIRPHEEVVAYLRNSATEHFLDVLPALPGGGSAQRAVLEWLDRFGMRCVGEIDITRTRWSEQPTSLIPLILTNIDNFEHGAGRRLFQDGLDQAAEAERDLTDRIEKLPDGLAKLEETLQMIDRIRVFVGYREYPKFSKVARYAVYKDALMREAHRLVEAGTLAVVDDVFYLRFEELEDVIRNGIADPQLIQRRRAEFDAAERMVPPRVLTSDGEALNGSYRRIDLPVGALPGLAVSSGLVEGRARVITDPTDVDLAPGDILVTRYTDPSWTPLFLSVSGVITEVGGLMTHGAVIAREYGVPAVVGVENATRLIPNGERIRLDGTNGFVELIDNPE